MLRRYWPHVWSTSGSIPVALKMARSTFQCLFVVLLLARGDDPPDPPKILAM
jgi:hypothetical protein